MTKPKLSKKARLVSDEALARVAHVIGPRSAARRVLEDLWARRERGEHPVCFFDRNHYIIFKESPADG